VKKIRVVENRASLMTGDLANSAIGQAAVEQPGCHRPRHLIGTPSCEQVCAVTIPVFVCAMPALLFADAMELIGSSAPGLRAKAPH
jgi:hypothetical protein